MIRRKKIIISSGYKYQSLTCEDQTQCNFITRSMENLPMEIFHRIFDHLDIETIFFSIRPVSRSFRSIVLKYDRFDFHLKHSSKVHFNVLCRSIPPHQIRSLTLYNNEQIPDQIHSFLQRVHLRQLIRLHSIDFDGINEFQLNYFLRRINVDLLRSFSVVINKQDDRRRRTKINYLSKVVEQPTLRHLYLNIRNSGMSDLSWPKNCSIECLTINGDLEFDTLMKISSCSPQLHRLIILETFSGIDIKNIEGYSFPQLRSLVLEEVKLIIDELESFLLLTPSLSYLKLMGTIETFDGKRWEDFIQINLPHLDQFQFDIKCHKMKEQTLKTFRRPFWLEDKKWFVQCEWNPKNRVDYQLYSIPMCKSSLEIDFDLEKERISTSDKRSETTNIDEITLRLEIPLSESMLTSMSIPFFPNVTKLHLYFYEIISMNSINLSGIINLSQLIEVHLEFFHLNTNTEEFFYEILTLIGQSSQLSMLIIRNEYRQEYIYPYLGRILQRIPSQIKYLQIPLEYIEQLPMILQHCYQLRVLQFPKKCLPFSKQILQWIERNTIGSIFLKSNQYDFIWIGKIRQSNRKRIKSISQSFQFPSSSI